MSGGEEEARSLSWNEAVECRTIGEAWEWISSPMVPQQLVVQLALLYHLLKNDLQNAQPI